MNRPAYFCKEFKADIQVAQTIASIIGLRLYELYLNGQRVGDQVLAPGPPTIPRG